MTDRRRDVYIAIMVAAHNGKGLHLSSDEAWDLHFDDAIMTRASNGLDDQDRNTPWSDINPRRKRVAANKGPRP